MASPPERSIAPDPLGASLSWALTRSLPGLEERWLLRALLHRGPSAHEAWQLFTSRIKNLPGLFRTDTGGRKRLGPLLLASIRENGLTADPGLLTVLKTAYVREELRLKALRSIARPAFDALRDDGISFLVLKGAALSEAVYPDPVLRHAHDIDLLVGDDDLERAKKAVARAGFQFRVMLGGGRGALVAHRTMTPILLLTRFYGNPFYLTNVEAVRGRSRGFTSDELGSLVIPSPSDNLLQALGHASYSPRRSNLQWVTDAWMILQAEDSLDWSDLVEAVQQSRLEIPAFVMLRYLKEEIDAPVPEGTLASLAALATDPDKLRRDVALYGARRYSGRHPQLTALERPGWKERADLLRWQVFPSKEYLSWAYRNPPTILLPFIYLMRPVTFVAQVLKWRLIWRARSLAGRLPQRWALRFQEPSD